MILRSSEFEQLVKIPALISHYAEHLNEDEHLSFLNYIAQHYKSGYLESESEKHKGLPFKSHECHCQSQVLVFELFEPFVIGVWPVNLDTHRETYRNDYFLENVANIWQPPQWIVA